MDGFEQIDKMERKYNKIYVTIVLQIFYLLHIAQKKIQIYLLCNLELSTKQNETQKKKESNIYVDMN